MNLFLSMFTIETKKLFRQPMLWIILAVLAVVAVGMQVLMFAAAQVVPTEGAKAAAELERMRSMFLLPGALTAAIGVAGAGGLGGFLAVILSGAAITQEYQWRTLHFWLSRGVPRGIYALARFFSLLLPVLLFAAVALLAGGLTSLVITLGMEGSLRLDQVNFLQVGLGLLRAAYTLLPYAALALLLGVLTRSTAATIGIGMAIALLVENLLAQLFTMAGGFLASLVKFLPAVLSSTLLRLNEAITVGAPAAAPGAGMFTPGVAALILAVYTLLFLTLAAGRLYRQDLSG